jgi:DHA2 family multidrug resistance protein
MSGPTARTTTPNASPGAPAQAFAPLEGSARVWGTLALSAATFMNVLDSSIANVSLPAIAGDLGVSPNQGTWVITSFAVANAISLPLTGWLSQRFGQVRLFVASVILFVLASWLCGLAPNMATLDCFSRAARLCGRADDSPVANLLLASYPRAMAGTAMAMWGMTTLVAPVMGPLLGGWITDNMSLALDFLHQHPCGPDGGICGLGDLPQARKRAQEPAH